MCYKERLNTHGPCQFDRGTNSFLIPDLAIDLTLNRPHPQLSVRFPSTGRSTDATQPCFHTELEPMSTASGEDGRKCRIQMKHLQQGKKNLASHEAWNHRRSPQKDQFSFKHVSGDSRYSSPLITCPVHYSRNTLTLPCYPFLQAKLEEPAHLESLSLSPISCHEAGTSFASHHTIGRIVVPITVIVY